MVALRMGKRLAEIEGYEDMVQDSMLDAFESLAAFQHKTEGSFRNWLATLAHNTIRDRARKATAQKRDADRARPLHEVRAFALSDSIIASREPTPSELAMGRELEDKLEAALLQLDERQRRVIELRRICEMSFEEIAAELGLGAQSSARALFSRALNHLSELL